MRVMGTAKLLWYFAWRTALLGAAAGALLAGLYQGVVFVGGTTVSALTSGTPEGAVTGSGAFSWLIAAFLFACALACAQGAVLGFLLGATGGPLAALLTRSFSPAFAPDAPSYPGVAGAVCAGWAALALLADWLLHDFPNIYGFALARGFNGDVLFEDSPASSAVSVVIVERAVIFGVAPTVLLASGMWWAGGRVAARYAQRNRGTPG